MNEVVLAVSEGLTGVLGAGRGSGESGTAAAGHRTRDTRIIANAITDS